MKAIEKAIEILGSQRKLAEKLEIQEPSSVSQWLNGHRKVPLKHLKQIEELTRGKVKRKDLRPDLYL